ncbi:hypothetical protein A0H76_2038 [Hepatospora eriocheir]|uniref:Signal peptidase complex subunit 1 n=1 Tax=Hepatospora eriocheir TaxID=1081669 RepID=A0A1X0Q9V5_9MICR|nr:hypothetical protein HERIO_1532 [Hepatospora eriocheir]ORE00191.1 hypothetical protein A0H76_2038 [Hepatospora eriocheir]
MMLFNKISNLIDPKLDYYGQKHNKIMMHSIFLIGFTLSLILGLIFKKIKIVIHGMVATVIINLILTIPSWYFYRKNPLLFKKRKTE